MKRCLILIGNEGSPADSSYLPGVRQDIDRYREFFKSDFGGAWEESEIESTNYNWTREGLRNKLLLLRMNGLDYALIVFAGHGFAERNGNIYFELSPNQEVSLTEIESWLPYQKMLMIADSCQGYIEESLSRSLTESIRTFSSGGQFIDSRDTKRRRYNSRINQMVDKTKVFVSAVSVGECAEDTSKGGLYSRTLMDTAELIIDRFDGSRKDWLICDIHSFAAEEVEKKSNNCQHPRLIIAGGDIYPPFLIL